MKRSYLRGPVEDQGQRLNPYPMSSTNLFELLLFVCSLQFSFAFITCVRSRRSGGHAFVRALRNGRKRFANEGRGQRRAPTGLHEFPLPAIFLIRNRSAFNFMKPSASRWLYTVSRSNVANASEYKEQGERRPTTEQLPLYNFSRAVPVTFR